MAIALGNVTTTSAAVYTSSGDSAVTFLTLCNYSASNVAANVHVVPSGDTADITNITLIGLELTASGNNTGDTFQVYSGGEKLLLADGDSIQISATANNAITAVTSFTSI